MDAIGTKSLIVLALGVQYVTFLLIPFMNPSSVVNQIVMVLSNTEVSDLLYVQLTSYISTVNLYCIMDFLWPKLVCNWSMYTRRLFYFAFMDNNSYM
jgi:hypothetical protein